GRGARQRVRGWDVNEKLRVVSTSLCGDAYVLSMVAEEDIAALSWQSGDTLSTAPVSFKDKPKARDDIETLLTLNPSLVVFGPGEGVAAKPLLDKRGIKYVSLAWGEDFEAVQKNMDLLVSAAYRDTVQANIIQRLPRERASILYLSASGGTAGSGTYVDAAIKSAGGRNIIATGGWHTPSIESLVALNPDLIITSFFKDGYASVNASGLRNKVLQDKIKTIPRVNVPGKLWPCAGPGLYAATDIIAKAIEGLN
ncbi:MAG: ABC transporter substrate-binding protein, partial [Robiginitomaculum sp.]|nr:ABC transporter substrate-binding protein [Robiginitomaculum sp.]